MAYRIEFKPAAAKPLRKLPAETRKRIAAQVTALAENPRPPGSEKMQGEESFYRIRAGEYRIVYAI